MDTKGNDIKGSKGLLDDIIKDAEIATLNSTNIEMKNSINTELYNSTNEENEEMIKTGYRYKTSTLRKLDEMKTLIYPRKTSYETIVDEAICMLYEFKKQQMQQKQD